jgi:hypothetical protein
MKTAVWIGLAGSGVAACLWFFSRWTHEILRCLRHGETASVEARCMPVVEGPTLVFHSWTALTALVALWGVYLYLTGRRRAGGLTIGGAVGVILLALSFM